MFIAMAAVGGAKTNVPQNIGGQTGKFAGHREKPRYEYVVFRAYDSIGDVEAALLDGTLDFAHDLNGFSPGDFLSEEHFHPPRLPWGAVLNSLSKLEQLAATPPTTVANLTRPTRFMYAHAHVLIAPFPFSSLSLLPVDALFPPHAPSLSDPHLAFFWCATAGTSRTSRTSRFVPSIPSRPSTATASPCN